MQGIFGTTDLQLQDWLLAGAMASTVLLLDEVHNRLEKLDLERDIKYCLEPNQCPVLPVLEGKFLVKHT